jgi:hypothetical protein
MIVTIDKTSQMVAFDVLGLRMPPLRANPDVRLKSGMSSTVSSTMNFVRHRLQRTFFPSISLGTDDVAEHWGQDASTDMLAISRRHDSDHWIVAQWPRTYKEKEIAPPFVFFCASPRDRFFR